MLTKFSSGNVSVLHNSGYTIASCPGTSTCCGIREIGNLGVGFDNDVIKEGMEKLISFWISRISLICYIPENLDSYRPFREAVANQGMQKIGAFFNPNTSNTVGMYYREYRK